MCDTAPSSKTTSSVRGERAPILKSQQTASRAEVAKKGRAAVTRKVEEHHDELLSEEDWENNIEWLLEVHLQPPLYPKVGLLYAIRTLPQTCVLESSLPHPPLLLCLSASRIYFFGRDPEFCAWGHGFCVFFFYEGGSTRNCRAVLLAS